MVYTIQDEMKRHLRLLIMNHHQQQQQEQQQAVVLDVVPVVWTGPSGEFIIELFKLETGWWQWRP
jgi:hypothetical protein